jgi:uncharacterized protein YjdB
MKRLRFLFAACTVLAVLFAACKQPTDDPGDTNTGTPVTGVTIQKNGADAGDTLTVAVGGSDVQLTAVVSPAGASDADKAVTWASDNGKVTVVDGLVHAVEAGTATITVTTAGKKADGNFATDSIAVTINATPDKVTGVIIKLGNNNVTAIDVREGSPVTLTAVVAPDTASAADKVVTWSSNDEAVATVEAATGVVTWIAEGTATITATTVGKKEDGNSATAEVTVNAKPAARLVVYNKGTPDDGTTTALPALNGANRYVITNTTKGSELGGNWDGDTTGKTLVYLDTPVTGDFELTARVKVVESKGDATGLASTVLIGALLAGGTDQAGTALGGPPGDGTLWFAGIRLSPNAVKARYLSRTSSSLYTSNAFSGTGSSAETSMYEYLYKVTRTSGDYSLKIYDTKDTTKEVGSHTLVSGQDPQAELRTGSVYPGFVLAGIEAEISNVIITEGTTTVFSSGESAYTPVPATAIDLSAAGETAAGDADYVIALANWPTTGVQLVATFTPPNSTDDINWSITSGSNGAVNGGLVTATGAGEFTVKAEVVGTNVSKEYKFNILSEIPPVESVSISERNERVEVEVGLTLTMEATVTPLTAEQEVYWIIKPDQLSVATIDGETGVLTATGIGSVMVYAISYNGVDGEEVESEGYSVNVIAANARVWSWRPSDDYSLPSTTTFGELNGKKIIIRSGTATKESGGIRTGSGGVRLVIGSDSTTDSASSSVPEGEFDFKSKPVKITITFTGASNTTGNFQFYVNNNTTSNTNSPLGTSSRPISKKTLDQATEYTVTCLINNGTADADNDVYKLASEDASLSKAFFMIRCDGSLSVLITRIDVEYVE